MGLEYSLTLLGLKVAFDNSAVRLDNNAHWRSFRSNQHFYRRGFDNQIYQVRNTTKEFVDNPTGIQQKVTQFLRTLCDLPPNTFNTIALELLTKALCYSNHDYQTRAEQFTTLYADGVPILPPTHVTALVVEPATGCPYARCNFCAFYQNNTFSIKSPQQFAAHMRAITDFYVHELTAREGIFLGSASALSIPQSRLVTLLSMIKNHFLQPNLSSISSFFDPLHAPKRTLDDWFVLHNLGVTHAIIGLETANQSLRQQLNKAVDLRKLTEQINLLKQANLRVGLTVLTGIGSYTSYTQHIHDTAEYLQTLPLDQYDCIYLSPLKLHTATPAWGIQQAFDLAHHLKNALPVSCIPYTMSRFHYA